MERLRRMNSYAFTSDCLMSYLLKYFGQYSLNRCEVCTNCLNDYVEEEITSEARLIVDAIKDTGLRYGVTVIGQLLSGSNSQRISAYNLNKNPLYGALKTISQKKIIMIINELIHQGYLDVTSSEYPTLTLTEMTDTLTNDLKHRVMMRTALIPLEKRLVKETISDIYFDQTLFSLLRQVRLEIARENHLPPYIIHSDKTLREMAAKYPATREEMLSIHGVGQNKHALYGEPFIRCILNYMEQKKTDIEKISSAESYVTKEIDYYQNKIDSLEYDEVLYEKLRQLRNNYAREKNVSAFIIFSNSSLKNMSIRLPKNKEEMLQISGVGETRFDQYGRAFIKLIHEYQEENNNSMEFESFPDKEVESKSQKDMFIKSQSIKKDNSTIKLIKIHSEKNPPTKKRINLVKRIIKKIK